MANKIQIKRSTSNATVSGLSNGELAFTQASNTLHIGLPDGSGVLRIGGAQYPGTLTASHALVANSTSGIDKVIVANLVPSYVWANGAAGTSGQLLTSNSTGGVYWNTPPASVAGSNTQVQFNDGGTLAGDADFTYNKTSNELNVSGAVNSSVLSVGTNIVSNSTQFTLASGIKFAANGAVGSANQVLRSSSSGVAYWSTDDGDISGVSAGNGLSGGGSSGDITVSALANNGIVANSTGLFVNAGTGVTVNATGVHIGQPVGTTDNVTFANVVTTNLTVNGNTSLGDATSDKVTITARVASNLIPTAKNTYDIGSNTLRWNNLYANSLTITAPSSFGGNVSIDGTLTVSGNLVTQNVQSVIVSDPMIYLAGNNYTSDLVDIGFAANYNDGSTNRHTGFFRDHTDGFYKLFYNLTQELSGNNDVDVSDLSYRTATLVAYLISGGLTTNTTSANLVANSTYTVGIAANSLTLSSPLVGTSGGTGKATVTNNALLVGNSTNGYNELTLGTSGYVLQSNGSALVYDTLDGGTF